MSGTSVIILELFSGVGSVAALGSRVLHCNAVTLDVDPVRSPSICTDIAEVSDTAIQSLKSEYPAVEWIVWASPPCDQYSRAHTCGTRDSERADVLAKRMWKFIDILKPERSPRCESFIVYDVEACLRAGETRDHVRRGLLPVRDSVQEANHALQQ